MNTNKLDMMHDEKCVDRFNVNSTRQKCKHENNELEVHLSLCHSFVNSYKLFEFNQVCVFEKSF